MVINKNSWKLQIIELDGWNKVARSPSYDTLILDKPYPAYSLDWLVGERYIERENYILGLAS